MQNLIWISIFVVSVTSFSNCKKKPEPVPVTYHALDPEVSKYFADFEVGDCWVYEDSITGKRDTIELISKQEYDSRSLPPKQGNPETHIDKYQGWALHYKPKLSREFKVYISTAKKGTYFHAKIDAMLAATGGVEFVKQDGAWQYGAKVLDSVIINKHVYYNVLPGIGNTVYMYNVKVNEKGIVSFWAYQDEYSTDRGGVYYLIATFKR